MARGRKAVKDVKVIKEVEADVAQESVAGLRKEIDESRVTWLPKDKAAANQTVEALDETKVVGGVEFVKCLYK